MKSVPGQNMFDTQEQSQYRRRRCSVPRNKNSTGAEHVPYLGTRNRVVHGTLGCRKSAFSSEFSLV